MDLNEWDPHPIFDAVVDGDVEEVRRRLEAKPHLMEARDSDEEDLTILMMAAKHGHIHLVRLLLEMGAEVNAHTFYGIAALHSAAEEGHGEVVSLLLSSGADSSRRDDSGFNALMLACCNNHVGAVRPLLQHMRGRGLDEQDTIEGFTALGWACGCGYVEVCRTLLLAGADHTVGSYEERPPQEVHAEGYMECMDLIEWWGGELERGYVLQRARCLSELPPLPTGLATVSMPTYLAARVGPLPTVQVVPLAEGSNGAAGEGEGEEGGGRGEEEKDATLKYVLHDLAPELVIELMEGFYRYKGSSRYPDST